MFVQTRFLIPFLFLRRLVIERLIISRDCIGHSLFSESFTVFAL